MDQQEDIQDRSGFEQDMEHSAAVHSEEVKLGGNIIRSSHGIYTIHICVYMYSYSGYHLKGYITSGMLRIAGEGKRQSQLSLCVARGQSLGCPYASTQFIHGTKLHHPIYTYRNPAPAVGLLCLPIMQSIRSEHITRAICWVELPAAMTAS